MISTTGLFLSRTTAPTEYPITLDEAKTHLRELSYDQDSTINALIQAVTEYFDVPDGVLGHAIITQTWNYSFASAGAQVILPINPVQSISSINYYDTDNVEQSLTVSDFYLYKNEEMAYLEPKSGITWPSTYDRKDAVTVSFVCGFGAASEVPQLIKQAMLLTLAHWYENRSATTDIALNELPMAVNNIISLYRRGWVG